MRDIILIFSNKVIRCMRGAEMRAFDVYVGNMNFAFLSGKGMHLKRKTAINFGR